MSMYNVINGLLFKRHVDRSSIEEMHVPFMFIKWFSFYDPACVELASELNRVGHQFADKQVSFNFFDTVVPKLKYKKIPYIKKAKKKAKRKKELDREHAIEMLAKSYEISQRESKNYLDMLDTID